MLKGFGTCPLQGQPLLTLPPTREVNVFFSSRNSMGCATCLYKAV